MFLLLATVVLTALGVGVYLAVASYRRPSKSASIDAQMRKDTVQLCAHVLACDDTGWVIPDHIVELANKILATKEIHQ